MQSSTMKLGKYQFSLLNALDNTIKSWGAIILFGQLSFACYIFTLYALPTLLGQTEVTHTLLPGHGVQNKPLFDGVLYFSHIVPAIILCVGGILQLTPAVRKAYPKFHRINGRVFFVLGMCGAVTGLYLTWVAGLRFSNLGAMGVTLNGMLILVFSYFAWQTARKKQFMAHQRFAVHSFLLVNGVWTFRLYLMGWYMVNQGPLGNSRTVDGPTDIILSFACYLLPMLIAEVYFWAKRSKQHKLVCTAWLLAGLGTLITLIGVVAASLMMWFPRIGKVFAALV